MKVHRKTHQHTTSTSHFLTQKHDTSLDTVQSSEVAERIGLKEGLVQTAPGVFTVTEETGEKFHINEEILKTLVLDGLSEDEAIQMFIESGAIVLEGMIPREPSTSLVKALSFTDDQYDEYARAEKGACSPRTKTDSRKYEEYPRTIKETTKLVSRPGVDGNRMIDSTLHISRETDSDIPHQEPFSSYVDGNVSGFVFGTGEKIKVDVKFDVPTSTYNTKHIRAKDLPENIRSKLLSLLYAQRQKKGLQKDKDYIKGEKKGSFVARREWNGTDTNHTMMADKAFEKDGRRVSVAEGLKQTNSVTKEVDLKQSRKGIESKQELKGKGQDIPRPRKGMTQGSTQSQGMTQGSTQTQDKRSVPKPTIVWEGRFVTS